MAIIRASVPPFFSSQFPVATMVILVMYMLAGNVIEWGTGKK